MKKRILRLLVMATFYSFVIFVCQCLFLTIVVASELSAQSSKSVKEVEISVRYNDARLLQVFNDLETRTNYNFVFDKKDQFLSEKFSFSRNNITVEELLIEISKQYQLKFKQVNNNITVNRNGKIEEGEVEIALQARAITGRVVDKDNGEGLPGVNIMIKGTNLGTVSDINGDYAIDVPGPEAVLIFSSVGYVLEEITVGSQSVIDISMAADITSLQEIVVVGYGVQKKALNTGANLQVKGDDLQRQNTTNALQALQGQAPGVQISSTSGQPGEGLRVVIRGPGTVGNPQPLYVVDGVLTGDITFLNNADIESIDVLKDAASAAIYGSQAANGVIIVTTKQGRSGKPQISFDAFYGHQNVPRQAELLNSREYAAIMNEAAVNSGRLPHFTNEEIAEMGAGTNWIDEMFVSDAVTQNYSISAQGGNDNSVYSASVAYIGQEGIVGGKDLSNYERYNFRLNTEHKLYKEYIKFGQHLTFAHIESNGIGVGNQYNNSLRGAFNTSPFVPMRDEEGNFWDNSESAWNNTEANPYAVMVYNNQNRRNNQKLLGDIYLEVQPIKNLKFRTSLGFDMFANESRSYSPRYRLSIYSFRDFSDAYQYQGKGRTLIWDNLLSYGFTIEEHRFDVMAGSAAFQYQGSEIEGRNSNLVIEDLKYGWLNNATNNDGTQMMVRGKPFDPDHRMSYFGRVNYNYRETYLLNATFRADGSSRFARGSRWGYFPSVSAGWVLTNEAFMGNTQGWLNHFKLRGSWGQVGNQNILAFQFLTPVRVENTNYIFGPEEGSLTPGAYPNRLANPDVRWETSEQINAGFDARFMSGKLTVNFDWYNKSTKDWLVTAPVLATAGADAPFINGGNIVNRGIELALVYNNSLGDFNYSVGVNGAYNKNTVSSIPTDDGIIHGESNQLYANSLEFYRAQNGFPVGYFWGLQTAGLFQTEEEVVSHRSSEGQIIQPSARPGDVRYVDQNGDGIINDLDRVMIGNPNPKYTFGFTFNFDYKGFDFSVLASGVAGNQIVQSYRDHSNPFANYTTAILDRWHGPGSSDRMPRVTEDSRNWTNFSDLYIQDGDFLRVNNVTLGYDFSNLLDKKFANQVRLYVSVLNLYTFTNYEGMDPEIGYGIEEGDVYRFSSGVDLGYYPRPRTYMLGLNVKF